MIVLVTSVNWLNQADFAESISIKLSESILGFIFSLKRKTLDERIGMDFGDGEIDDDAACTSGKFLKS